MKRMIRLPRTAMLLLAWLYFSSPAHAQNATWIGTTSDWNTGTNWSSVPPATVPTGTATFDATGITKSLTFSAAASIGTLQFNAPGYTLSPSSGLSITGSGIQAATPADFPTFPFPVGQGAAFTNSSTAGPAHINVFG
jgi:hypothetical protein